MECAKRDWVMEDLAKAMGISRQALYIGLSRDSERMHKRIKDILGIERK